MDVTSVIAWELYSAAILGIKSFPRTEEEIMT